MWFALFVFFCKKPKPRDCSESLYLDSLLEEALGDVFISLTNHNVRKQRYEPIRFQINYTISDDYCLFKIKSS